MECVIKENYEEKGISFKPILILEKNSGCQSDLIDIQTQSDGNFKFIILSQKQETEQILSDQNLFYYARYYLSERNLNDVFLTKGAPCILHSEDDREFVSNLIDD